MMKNMLKRLIMIALILSAASLACNFAASTPTPAPTAIPMNTEDLQQLEQNFKGTLESPNANGEVTFTMTQEQLTSIAASQLAKQSNPILTEPRIILTNGQMEVNGKVTQAGFIANIQAVLKPVVGADGTVQMEILSIQINSFAVPNALKDRFASTANTLIQDAIASKSNGFQVKDIQITEGKISITGTPKP